MVSMQFANISAGNFRLVYTIPTVVIASVEVLFHHMDRMGFFQSEQTKCTGTDDLDLGDSFKEEKEDEQQPRGPEDALLAENQAVVNMCGGRRIFKSFQYGCNSTI